MPLYTADGLLYLTVIASAYYAYRVVPETLNHIRNLAACPEQNGPGPRKQLQKDAENAINIETLRILSDGSSYDLRASTIKIVASRTMKSRTKKLLLRDLASTDEDQRYSAICAIWMLLYNPNLSPKQYAQNFLDYESFYALITALKNVLVDHDPNQPMKLLTIKNSLYPEPRIPPSPVGPQVRPYHETSLLMILRYLLDVNRPYAMLLEYSDNMKCALSAGLVTRWLKDYPFPCALPQNSRYNYKKSDVVKIFHDGAWATDDAFMARLIRDISRTVIGKQQLRDAGLQGLSGFESKERWRQSLPRFNLLDSGNDIRMINGESTAGAATPPPIASARPQGDIHRGPLQARTQELSPEEENLRRRRREAIVVAEPGTSITQDNILQRTDSGSDWRSNPEELVEHFLDTDDIQIPHQSRVPSDIVLTPETEEAFRQILASFRVWRIAVDNLLRGAMREDYDPSSELDEFGEMLISIHEDRDRSQETIRGWQHVSDENRLHLEHRVSHVVYQIVSNSRTARMLQRLRARRMTMYNSTGIEQDARDAEWLEPR